MLRALRLQDAYEICGLVTTVNAQFDRVAMHGVRRELLEAQAVATGLPLWEVALPWPCSNDEYELRMGGLLSRARAAGVELMAFGDLFLEDIRDYRERMLAGSGVVPLFPLWKLPTYQLAREMIGAGLRARVVCVDPKQLDGRFAGRAFDADFLEELPPGADPCGENGEFHTFVWAGPMFFREIAVEPGETVEHDGFVFADLHCVATIM